ncbi:MAG: glutathione S-transferase N-terminal domain-containing protein [Hyphomicrobiales bacterium]|nr:glutathione S-transferase N-terminal domain-containing protein [Hyphomicrobiales bacterium]
MLRLVHLPISLYSFKVRLAVAAMRLDIPMIEPQDGSYRSPAYRALVPPAKIPALLGPDGVLTETDAIIEYLDEALAGSRLMHGGAFRRARVRMLSRLIDLRLEAAVRSLFGQIAPAHREVDEIAHARDRILAALDVLEWALDPEGPYSVDASVSMADCSLAATAIWLDAVKPELLPDVVFGPRWRRAADALQRDSVTGPPIADYRNLVSHWVAARLRRPGADADR